MGSFAKYIQADAKKSVFLTSVSRLNSRLEEEKRRMVEQSSKGASGGEKGAGKGANAGNWSSDEMALLIKAVNLFPAGEEEDISLARWLHRNRRRKLDMIAS